MKVHININKILQYMLFYIMLLFNSSTIMNVLSGRNPDVYQTLQITIIFIWGIFFLIHRKCKIMVYTSIMFVFLILTVSCVRFITGGIGIGFLLEYIACIAIATLAIRINRKYAALRFVNLVYILEILSIVFFLFQIVKPELLQAILSEYDSMMTYSIWDYAQEVSVSVNYSTWGRFIFSMHEASITRNTSIFSEPANYQIVINASLFVLLFFRQQLGYSDKQYLKRFIVALVALLTCQSTTGYVCAGVMIFAFILQKQENGSRIGKRVLGVILIVLLMLVIEFIIDGNNSLLMNVIGDKLFDNGSLDLNTSTGYWRVASITAAGLIMLKNPFGVGVENAYKSIEKAVGSSAGGALMRFGASIGIIPFIVVIVWTLYPVVSCKRINRYAKFSFVLFYFMTVLAQTNVFYPGIIVLTLLCLNTVFIGETKNENSMGC